MRSLQAAAILLATFAACMADDEPQFHCRKPIQIAPRTQDELVMVRLDQYVYAATADNLADLRIVGNDGRAVGFLIQTETESKIQKTHENWPAHDVSVRPLEKGGLEIQLGLARSDPQPQGLSIETPLKNFQQRVEVFGIDAAGKERPLVKSALIFDYSQYMDASHLDVPLPPGSERRFRVVIDAATSDQQSQLLELTRHLRAGREEARSEHTSIDRRPFRIDRIEFFADVPRAAVTGEKVRPWPIVKFDVRPDDGHHHTIIVLQTRREPLLAFRLETRTKNFSRHATVEVPDIRGIETTWRRVGEGLISQFQLRDFKKQNLQLDFSEQRSARYRIVIDNKDNPPVEVSGVTAEGHAQNVIFLATPGGEYRLEYGADVAHSADYDSSAVQTALARGIKPITGTLGPETTVAITKPPALKARNVLENPLVIGAIIVALVILLGWALYQASRRIEQVPRDDG